MGEVITGRTFGDRKAHEPLGTKSTYGERRPELDAHYITSCPREFNAGMRLVQAATSELSVLVSAIRDKEPTRRRRSPMELPLHDLFEELCKGMGVLQDRAPNYAKLIVEIEERVLNAQSYLGEQKAHR